MTQELVYIVLIVLSMPLWLVACLYLMLVPFGWYYGDLDEMNTDLQTLKEMVLFGYAHLFALWPMIAGRHRIAAKIYGFAGQHYWKTKSGHWVVSTGEPDEDAEVVLA